MIVKDFKDPRTTVTAADILAMARGHLVEGGSLADTLADLGYPHDDLVTKAEQVLTYVEFSDTADKRVTPARAHGKALAAAIVLAAGINSSRRSGRHSK